VELLVPELQKRGIYWNDYPAPGGTLRENVHSAPGESLLPTTHPGAKVTRNAPKETEAKSGKAEVVVSVDEAASAEVKRKGLTALELSFKLFLGLGIHLQCKLNYAPTKVYT
jgi:hypothetical protein